MNALFRLSLKLLGAFILLDTQLQAQELRITDFDQLSDQAYRITWAEGLPPFEVVQTSQASTSSITSVSSPTSNRSLIVTSHLEQAYFRVRALGAPAAATAEYQITFSNNWSAINHPSDYPASAHYSSFIGATHNAQTNFWRAGILATPGIQLMAETGSNVTLINEINTAISAGSASGFTILNFIFTASQDFPLLSMVSMIAPSPDWFVGVHDLSLFAGDQWVDDLTIQLFPYDAGTDDGNTYATANVASMPHVNIFRILGFPFLNEGELRPMGSLRIQRMDL